MDALTLRTPNGANTLIERLTFSVADGEQLLIMGPSGSGKTSLLRALAGLWQSGAGPRQLQRQSSVTSESVWPRDTILVYNGLRPREGFPK